MSKKLLTIAIVLIASGVTAWNYLPLPNPAQWTEAEIQLIDSLSLANLPLIPPDPSNAVADLEQAAELGYRLFFDTRLSSDGNVACATCHQPELMFTDGLRLSMGAALGTRNAPSLVGIAYSPWFYWDGRKDSQWAQALAPLEAEIEHGSDRVRLTKLMQTDSPYAALYQTVFGSLPVQLTLPESASPLGNRTQQAAWKAMDAPTRRAVSQVFANLGKAIAAYQRKLIPGLTAFDTYAAAVIANSATRQPDSLSASQVAGLRIFIGKAQCVSCHNGPLFTNSEFHNTGVLAVPGQLPAMGRYDGIRLAREDPFNCTGEFSDATASDCIELRFAADSNDLVGAHKTPTLRNLTLTAPYMHGGQIDTLRQVLQHYNDAPLSMLSHNEAKPLGLRPVELRQLENFLTSLTAPLATAKRWLRAPAD